MAVFPWGALNTLRQQIPDIKKLRDYYAKKLHEAEAQAAREGSPKTSQKKTLQTQITDLLEEEGSVLEQLRHAKTSKEINSLRAEQKSIYAKIDKIESQIAELPEEPKKDKKEKTSIFKKINEKITPDVLLTAEELYRQIAEYKARIEELGGSDTLGVETSFKKGAKKFSLKSKKKSSKEIERD